MGPLEEQLVTLTVGPSPKPRHYFLDAAFGVIWGCALSHRKPTSNQESSHLAPSPNSRAEDEVVLNPHTV